MLISANRRPSTAVAWLLAIVFIPFLGALVFFLIGLSRLPRNRREKQQQVNKLILERAEGLHRVGNSSQWPRRWRSVVTLNENLGAPPMVGGNRIDLINDYQGCFEAMIRDIDTTRT